MIRTTLTVTLIAVLAVLTSACNTMQGVGQDMKVGGQKLKSAAAPKKSSHCQCATSTFDANGKPVCNC